MTIRISRLLVASCLVSLGAGAQAATYTTLSLPNLTADIRGWTGGSGYNSLFPGTSTWNGVPFELAEDGSGHTVWYATSGSVDIDVGVYGVTDAYTIINSAYGARDYTIGSIEFIGSGGLSYTVNLVEGVNVRDHYNGFYNNTIDGVTAIDAFYNAATGARLDTQVYRLPTSFASATLETIRFSVTVNSGVWLNGGYPFLAAATVAAVPEPATMALGLAGVGIVMACGVRRRLTGECRRRS